MRLFARFLLLALLGGACAHTPKSTGMEGLKPIVEQFNQRIRWKDFRGAARHIVPERREAFLKARRDMNDERDLSITDFEVLDAQLTADGMRGFVTTRLQWMRLPSPSEQTATVTEEYIYVDKTWQLERMLDGPFAGELP